MGVEADNGQEVIRGLEELLEINNEKDLDSLILEGNIDNSITLIQLKCRI